MTIVYSTYLRNQNRIYIRINFQIDFFLFFICESIICAFIFLYPVSDARITEFIGR